jgi:hypothetical protein
VLKENTMGVDLRTRFFMKQMAGKLPIPADLLIREFPS